jgi:hypothetical protein
MAVGQLTQTALNTRYFAPRWIVARRDDLEVDMDLPFKLIEHDPEHDDEYNEEIEKNVNERMDIPLALHFDIAEILQFFPTMSEKNLFLSLLHFSQALASRCAGNLYNAMFLMVNLQEL